MLVEKGCFFYKLSEPSAMGEISHRELVRFMLQEMTCYMLQTAMFRPEHAQSQITSKQL
jgi:hypothetical protein